MKYILAMFPYPSGALHIGHLRVYALADALARFHRPKLFALGWDAFGLPAENAAKQHSLNPAVWTKRNIDVMRSQLKSMNLAVDWDLEISTCHPGYYKHSQRLFLSLLADGLVVRKKALVNWDPIDQTVLANEQVDANGRADRSGAVVEQKMLKQWFFEITKYAEPLLEDLDSLTEWPRNVKQLQKNWIGKSEGLEIDFGIVGRDKVISVFTTRPETLRDVKFIAVSPYHPLLEDQAYTDLGVFPKDDLAGRKTDILVRNPATMEDIPVYVANYVVSTYANGAVMGVPSTHPVDAKFYSEFVTGEPSILNEKNTQLSINDRREARRLMTEQATKHGFARSKTVFKLRDWLISRQRYWGTPIPIIHCKACGAVPVENGDLPVLLPEIKGKDFSQDLVSERVNEWKKTKCPRFVLFNLIIRCKGDAERETDTMDTFVDSSWYYLRFCDPRNPDEYASREKLGTMPVDLYIGGVEHAILHLLYARFISKYLNDKGVLDIGPKGEPFVRLLAQGMVKGRTVKCRKSGKYLDPAKIDTSIDPDSYVESMEKMSKSKFNGVDPTHIISQFGSDVTRMYILSLNAPEENVVWDSVGIIGMQRMLTRVSRLAESITPAVIDESIRALENETIRKVSAAFSNSYALHTALADIFKLVNALQTRPDYRAVTSVVRMLAPYAPTLCDSIWKDAFGNKGVVDGAEWPVCQDEVVSGDGRMVSVSVVVGGRPAGSFDVPLEGIDGDRALEYAVEHVEVGKRVVRERVKQVILKEKKHGGYVLVVQLHK